MFGIETIGLLKIDISSIQVVFFDLGNTLVKKSQGVRAEWMEGAKESVYQLNNIGIRLGIISNTENINRDYLFKNLLPLDFPIELFETNLIILSSEAGIEKPNPEIFLYAVDKSDVSHKNCLFCSEDILETLVAQQIGMYSLWLALLAPYSIKQLADFLLKQV